MGAQASVSKGLIIRNPIEAAIRLSRQMTTQEMAGDSPAEREITAGMLSRIDRIKSGLLPIERGLLQAIRSRKSAAEKKAKQLKSLNKLGQYALFSLEPLTWRNKQGFPRLAVFSLKSPNSEFAVVDSRDWDSRRRWRQKVDPKLPRDVLKCYKDVLQNLSAIAKKTKKTARGSARNSRCSSHQT
ncbi:MAG: hypothetical protein HY455_02120 [Parcubacteria group bacterium]|nr:hypothetical protein [Parcubacteria group bacterium]